ncbi:hypothetical protein ACS3YM_14265 [Nocardia sp. N13]|uniref:hypothetical protein n=1 Tax=Nocardioides sp. N13(2025) TaxID=3453405 RepID=UPI003F769E8C
MDGVAGAWGRYDAWNEAIGVVMFPELETPEPVYLDFEDEAIEALGVRIGVPTEKVEAELSAAVASTLAVGGPATVFERHMRRTRQWVREGRSGTPPFLGVLATFCLAAERMARGEGMSSHNYFGRLHEVLAWDKDDHRLDQAYRRVSERLWEELNRWLLQLDGVRGTPTAFVLHHRYVGLSVSQALVRRTDRDRLINFFRQYGFAPGTDVAPTELELVLDGWMSQRPCLATASLQRLWSKGQARERIAQAAAVALASWDGRVSERAARTPGEPASAGHLVLTLEIGSFPHKRFALQALLYLAEPGKPRDALVTTATPAAQVELVPDLPGALGLGRGSSLNAGDVLEGVLRIRDSLDDQVVERRPRRMVLFREDELSRRWIESPQVMLGDDVRLLVHQDLEQRVRDVLSVVARPGWQKSEPYPGQPEGWTLFTNVEVFNHPGALVRTDRMDDLAPLVPLTSSQLKVADGFALPGQVRGKWHSWSPPEVRAVSDAPDGFTVRVVDLHRFEEHEEDEPTETVLAEWDDGEAGVVVQPLAALGLEDGDYRVELVPHHTGEVLTSTHVLLRSADTPDRRQWALLEQLAYGPGIGSLGVSSTDSSSSVKGHLVSGAKTLAPADVAVPATPSWLVGTRSATREVRTEVRLTMPDADSCLYTGRHREQIDMVEHDAKGRPLQAWSYGRCRECGLVRKYPTRLKASSYGRGRAPAAAPAPFHHDLSGLTKPAGKERDWSTAFDALLHTGGGSWSQLERIAFQIEPTALFVDQFARTLEVVGHLDVRRSGTTLEPTSWEVAPTALVGTEDGFLFSGYWPAGIYAAVGGAMEAAGMSLAVSHPDDGPASYFATCERQDLDAISDLLDSEQVPVVDVGWSDVAGVLPPLSEVLAALPRQSDSLVGDITWFRPRDNRWVPAAALDARGAYRVRRFSTVDVVRTDEDVRTGKVARCTVQLGKHLAALMDGAPLIAYDPRERVLSVPLGADLPGLYGRALVAASGEPPAAPAGQRLLQYGNVPRELACHIYDLFSR